MNQTLSPEYWNNRYLNNDFGWDTGSITTPLKTYFDQLTDKDLTILIPGAGNAYEAEYLINNGFRNVFVCDIATEPLDNLKKRCPAFKEENLLLVDFFDLDLNLRISRESHFERSREVDLIIEQTFFCAIEPSLRKKYFEKVAALLKPGGKLVGVLFDDALNKDKPPFGGNKEEYLSYIDPSIFKINVFEACRNSIKPRQGRELFINLARS